MTEPVRDIESEEQRAVDEAAPADGGATAAADRLQPQSLGATLARQRERLGLSINDVASRLRLHPRQLAAMEADRFEALPKGPFLRGFVRNYARQLRLDAQPLLAQLEQQLGPANDGADPGEIGGRSPGSLNRDRVSRAVVIGGALGALALFAVIGWVVSRPAATPTSPSAAPVAAAEAAAASHEPQPASDASGPDRFPSASEEKSAAAASATPVAPAAVPAATASKELPAGTLALRLVFGDRPSWVEVTQGDGRVLYSGINEPGSERRIVGQPPLRLVVGNASTVRVEARGRQVDLAPFIRGDDLARLTLE